MVGHPRSKWLGRKLDFNARTVNVSCFWQTQTVMNENIEINFITPKYARLLEVGKKQVKYPTNYGLMIFTWAFRLIV